MNQGLHEKEIRSVKVSLELEIPLPILERIKYLKSQLGFQSRGEVVMLLIEELLGEEARNTDELEEKSNTCHLQ